MHKAIRAAVEAIEESAWQTIEDYPKEGEAQIAETTHGGRRLIVRRTRLWPQPSCGPIGVTSRFSPTAPRTSRSWSQSIVITPSLNK